VEIPQRGGPRRRPIAVALPAAALLAALTLVAGCGAAAVTTSPGTPAPSATAGPVTVNLPVVSCPTSLGVVHAPVSLPASRPVTVPQALAGGLAVYADDQGIMALVGPKGWKCTASYGADGSGGVVVYPAGERVPRAWAAGWALSPASTEAAIAGQETSACYSCTLAQACRLFPSAATAWRSAFGTACPARPAAETLLAYDGGVVSFDDPPGVRGDGLPSGGRYSARSVLTYYPGASDGSWRETCTLPGSDQADCTVALGTFVSWYVSR
jgi:hypothetical protein